MVNIIAQEEIIVQYRSMDVLKICDVFRIDDNCQWRIRVSRANINKGYFSSDFVPYTFKQTVIVSPTCLEAESTGTLFCANVASETKMQAVGVSSTTFSKTQTKIIIKDW